MADATAELLQPGATFHGRYVVVRCIQAGGMGAVYEVVHSETRRRRALKTMLPSFVADAEMRARFRLEATVAAEIDSEHIVDVFDAGVDEETGLPFLVMDLLRGETLAVHLGRRGVLSREEILLVLHQASLALDRTHASGIVHRDLKPENLFLTRRDDGTLSLKLLDFGIAKVVAQSTQVNTTRSFGTPLYMSPEQIRGDGDIGHRADIYSLGQIAFTLVTGHPYWEPEAKGSAAVYGLLLKITEGAPEPASVRARAHGVELPPAFDEWFRTATAVDASKRFDSASELVEELAKALDLPLPGSPGWSHQSLKMPIESAGLEAAEPHPVQHFGVRPLAADSTGAISRESSVAGKSRSGRWPLFVAAGLTLAVGAALLPRYATDSADANGAEVPGGVSARAPVPAAPSTPSAAPEPLPIPVSVPSSAPARVLPSEKPRARARPRPRPAAVPSASAEAPQAPVKARSVTDIDESTSEF